MTVSETTVLFHATARSNLDAIARDGLRPGSYWTDNPDLASYYAGTVEDDGEDAVVLRVALNDLLSLDGSALVPDMPGIEEPITSVVGMSEDAVHDAWQQSEAKDWRACLELVGSLKFTQSIAPTLLQLDSQPLLQEINGWPVRSLAEVFHVGQMNPEMKGAGPNKTSLEGNGLSVSLHPEAWKRIARLGGNPTWSLKPSSGQGLFLDVLALSEAQRESIGHWGIANGLCAPKDCWEVVWTTDELDEEGPGQHCMVYEDEAQAILHKESAGDASISAAVRLAPSAKLIERIGFKPGLGLTWDMVMTAFVEDHLWAELGVHGAWWNEELRPEIYSAPRGTIHLQAASSWVAVDLARCEALSDSEASDRVPEAPPRPFA